jgi:hypothetical protein
MKKPQGANLAGFFSRLTVPAPSTIGIDFYFLSDESVSIIKAFLLRLYSDRSQPSYVGTWQFVGIFLEENPI